MKKAQKEQAENIIRLLYHVHDGIKKAAEQKRYEEATELLSQCQESAIDLGETIEKIEGEGCPAVAALENYCETVYQAYVLAKQGRGADASRICKSMKKALIRVENSVKKDITVRREVVFFPYKASMWDSLESVYLAAKEDPDCDAYCVPIPYYNLSAGQEVGQMHYEGGAFPEEIEVTSWQDYNFEEREPDVIYIHNPYDNWNLVTSVHPRYYSSNLKKYTETLVYIPYYSTSGGMSEAQKLCPAYLYANYIVIQSPKLRAYFDRSIPDEKFLPFGSPKFDRIIGKCQNPPKLPDEWTQRMEGKRVYFYNTSINGMLANTEDFLKKMRYVFSCFEGREDACLLWRPHPLLESTFESMRPGYKQEYLELKEDFYDKELGIYDTTPDMADAVAWSDAYIGDEKTSVVSLFGITGKPLFVLNNRLHSEPDKDSWRGEIQVGLNWSQQDRFSVTQGNKLYVSEPFAHDYRYLCDLSEDAYGGYYNVVWEIDRKLYVCPQNAQHILVIDENEGWGRGEISCRCSGDARVRDMQMHKIELEPAAENTGDFYWTARYGNYLILRPIHYPAMVCFNTATGEMRYFRDYIDVFIKEKDGALKIGAWAVWNGKVYNFSPIDRQVYLLDIETGETEVTKVPARIVCGCMAVVICKGDFWLLPYEGDRLSIVRWNPETDEVKEYDQFPEGFRCIAPISGEECMERPFAGGASWGGYMYFTPEQANMYVRMNMMTGEMTPWTPPFEDGKGEGYFYTTAKSSFLRGMPDAEGKIPIFSYPQRKLYEIHSETGECSELAIRFDVDELKAHEPGFCRHSQQLRYCCYENAFNSLKDFLDGTITGMPFNRERQLEAYREIAVNHDGSCGVKVHEFMSRL